MEGGYHPSQNFSRNFFREAPITITMVNAANIAPGFLAGSVPLAADDSTFGLLVTAVEGTDLAPLLEAERAGFDWFVDLVADEIHTRDEAGIVAGFLLRQFTVGGREGVVSTFRAFSPGAMMAASRKGVPDGDEVFASLPENASYRDFLLMALQSLPVSSRRFCKRMHLSLPHRSWTGKRPVPLNHLPDVIKLLRLFRFKKPWKVLYKLYKDVFDWAFTVRKQNGEACAFALKEPVDLQRLAREGLPAVLVEPKLENGFSIYELLDRVNRHLALKIGRPSLSLFLRGRQTPDFEELKALVAGFNEGSPKKKLTRGSALLAAYPVFISLLPLIVPGPNGLSASKRKISLFDFSDPPVPQARLLQKARPQNTQLDPQGLPVLIRRTRRSKMATRAEIARRLGLSVYAIDICEIDPPSQPLPTRTPGRLFLKGIADRRGLGLPMEEILTRFLHSYWRENSTVQALRERTFHKGVFVDLASGEKLKGYLQYDFQTPGEILYYWRNSDPKLLTLEEMALFLGVSRRAYEGWETNGFVPFDRNIERIAKKLGRSETEADQFKEACKRMRKDRFLALQAA